MFVQLRALIFIAFALGLGWGSSPFAHAQESSEPQLMEGGPFEGLSTALSDLEARVELLETTRPLGEELVFRAPRNLGDSIWVDGEMLRYTLEPIRQWAQGRLDETLNRLVGAQLTRREKDLQISVFFESNVSIDLTTPGKKGKFGSPRKLEMARETRMHLRMNGEILHLEGLAQKGHAARIKLRLPRAIDAVYLRNVRLDLLNGPVRIEVGLFYDTFVVVADAQYLRKKFEGVDIWETLVSNVRHSFNRIFGFLGIRI